MELPKTVKIEDVEGGKQVVIFDPETGKDFIRIPIIFSSMNGIKYPHLDRFLEDGIKNGFSLSVLPNGRELEFKDGK